MRVVLTALALAACSAAPRTSGGGGAGLPDAGATAMAADAAAVALAPNASDCPAAYPGGGGACTGRSMCNYVEGSCYCGQPPWCGGAAPPQDYDRQGGTWQCTPTVRADGCPGQRPLQGACAPEGKVCDYTCSCVAKSTCRGGVWVNSDGPCMP